MNLRLNMKVIIVVMMLLISIVCNSEETNKIRYENPFFGFYLYCEFDDEIFEYHNIAGAGVGYNEGNDEEQQTYWYPDEIIIDNYEINEINKIPFILSKDGEKKLIILKNNDICILYNSEYENPSKLNILSGYNIDIDDKYDFYPFSGDFLSTSFLTEGEIKYKASNLNHGKLLLPWVEGVSGQGVGEEISFSLKNDYLEENIIDGFYIINGYLSFEYPERYTKNSRIKTISMSDMTGEIVEIFEIRDTPNPQFIYLPQLINKDVILKILEVYPGTHYEDCCITEIILREHSVERYH